VQVLQPSIKPTLRKNLGQRVDGLGVLQQVKQAIVEFGIGHVVGDVGNAACRAQRAQRNASAGQRLKVPEAFQPTTQFPSEVKKSGKYGFG
jgi:hypothetical protein